MVCGLCSLLYWGRFGASAIAAGGGAKVENPGFLGCFQVGFAWLGLVLGDFFFGTYFESLLYKDS